MCDKRGLDLKTSLLKNTDHCVSELRFCFLDTDNYMMSKSTLNIIVHIGCHLFPSDLHSDLLLCSGKHICSE